MICLHKCSLMLNKCYIFMMSSQKKLDTLVAAARFYYEEELSQQQIAERLRISRPAVSRLLRRAREEGIVRIEILDPAGRSVRLERDLRRVYGLTEAVVLAGNHVGLEQLGRAGARQLENLVQDGILLGAAWGTTLQILAGQLRPVPKRDVRVVQLVGGFSRGSYNTHAPEITGLIAAALGAEALLLPVPAIVDSPDVKQALAAEKSIAATLTTARDIDLAVFSVGGFSEKSTLMKAQYFSPQEIRMLKSCGAVGDVCTHIINVRGETCSREMEERTIGIDLETLRTVPRRLVVAGGNDKAAALGAALASGLVTDLVTDETTAEAVLQLY